MPHVPVRCGVCSDGRRTVGLFRLSLCSLEYPSVAVNTSNPLGIRPLWLGYPMGSTYLARSVRWTRFETWSGSPSVSYT